MAAMAVFCLSGFIIIATVLVSTDMVEDRFVEYDQAGVNGQKYILSINRDMNYCSRLTRNIMLGDDYDKNFTLLEQRVKTIYTHFDNLDMAINLITDAKVKADLLRLSQESKVTTQGFLEDSKGRMAALGNQQRSPQMLQQAWTEYSQQSSPFANKARISFNALIKAEQQARADIQDSAIDAMSSMKRELVLISAASVLLVGLLLFLVTRSIMLGVNALQLSINQIEQDADLTQRITIVANDELGRVSGSFNVMLDKFQSSIQGVFDTATQLTSSANKVASVTAHAAESVQTQRHELDMVSTAMNEMTATVVEVAKNANEAADAANQTDRQSQTGLVVVNETVKSIEGFAYEIKRAAEVINAVEADSNEIGSILGVIKDIAEQTNLLALNAAIEAARAGEQGRGFAVVADEVRTLASRTQASTEQIQMMIDKLQGGAKEAVEVMMQSSRDADNCVNHANSTGEALQVIAAAVATITDMNAQIAAAAEEQSAVSEEINNNIVNISHAAEATAEGAKTTSNESENLARMAHQLSQLVQAFKI